jgi:hypothetical protein
MTEKEGEAQDGMMRIDSAGIEAVGALVAYAMLALCGCGDARLDLGHDQSTPPPIVDGPRYATREELAAADWSDVREPTVMATHQYGAVSLAIDDTRVYWITQGVPETLPGQFPRECSVVRSCAKDDCAGTVVTYAYLQSLPRYLAVNQNSVFWDRTGGRTPIPQIVSCPITGCRGEPLVIASGISPISLVADESHVYWQSSDAALLRCPVQGCVGAPELVASLDQFSPQDTLTLDGSNLYWLTGNGAAKPGGVATVPKDGSAPARSIVEGVLMPRSLAIQGDTVYWSESYTGGAVKRCPFAGCSATPMVLASSVELPALLDVDGDRAFWFLSTGMWYGQAGQDAPAQLVQCSVDGCGSSPTVLVTEPHGPVALAVDSTHIYWAASGEKKSHESDQYDDSTIQRLPRPR